MPHRPWGCPAARHLAWTAGGPGRRATARGATVLSCARAAHPLEGGLNRDSPPVAVHVGGCHMAGTRWKGVPRDVALRALSEGIEACG
ncbi:DUF6233 domain-containing protein, partial [Streptomyces sp. NPDC056821]|uniref:DUF6233 domain-containing protein n=1 Tax=unclassified Streptomyces TaxID=2593676 RepID=UPI0036820456